MVNKLEKLLASPPESDANWELQALKRAHLLHGQLQAAILQAASSNLPELRDMDFMSMGSPYIQRLQKLYTHELALARLLDGSDLLLHAEGPGAADNSPRLSTVNWLCGGAEKRIKQLLEAMLPMAEHVSKRAASLLDLRLNGLASGSLYAGFSLAGLDSTGVGSLTPEEDVQTLDWLRSAIHALPVVPQFVGTEKMDDQIMEALPDPALRDAAMATAYELSPTGNKGIHTVEISSPNATDQIARNPHPLGQKERVVLREATRGAPMMRKKKHGFFIGQLRAIDLDTERIVVRGISAEIHALRGALARGAMEAKALLNLRVKVTGDYECDANGRPRMMRVERIEPAEQSLPFNMPESAK